MSFLKSILLGYEGSYNILGIPVTFESQNPPSNSNQEGISAQFIKKCLSNNVFRWVTQAYTHTFVHEMAHALMSKSFPRRNFFSQEPNTQVIPKVKVFITTCEGKTEESLTGLIGWKKVLVCAAGPMVNIAFSSCKLVAAQILKSSYLTWPIAVALEGSAIIEISSELYYAYDSATKENDGDFGIIAREGSLFLGLASTALITECALGILASTV
jgi:hypothetical protein